MHLDKTLYLSLCGTLAMTLVAVSGCSSDSSDASPIIKGSAGTGAAGKGTTSGGSANAGSGNTGNAGSGNSGNATSGGSGNKANGGAGNASNAGSGNAGTGNTGNAGSGNAGAGNTGNVSTGNAGSGGQAGSTTGGTPSSGAGAASGGAGAPSGGAGTATGGAGAPSRGAGTASGGAGATSGGAGASSGGAGASSGGAGASSGGAGTGGAAGGTAGAAGAAGSSCKADPHTDPVISDFATDANLKAVDNRQGIWTVSPAAAGTVTVAAGEAHLATPSAVATDWTSGSTVIANISCWNASQYTGIQFDIKSPTETALLFEVPVPETAIDYAHVRKPITVTATYQTIQVPWTALVKPTWGSGLTVDLATVKTKVTGIAFGPNVQGEKLDIYLKNVKFY